MSPESGWGPLDPRLSALQPNHIPSHSVGTLGAGSDYAPFIHFLGISSMDIAYTYDQVRGNPLVPARDFAPLAPSSPSGCSCVN